MFDGGDHDSVIVVGDAAVAVTPTGELGVLTDDEAVGVADASDDVPPVPTEFIADTRYT